MLETLRIHQNTDTVDIDQKCLGLTTNIMGPERDNRGLSIQIRHNRHPVAFRKANEISRLISTAPDLLSSLESVIFFLEDYLEDSRERDARIAERDNCKGYISAHTENIIRDIKAAKLAIKKAKGEL